MSQYEDLIVYWGQNVKGMIFIYTRVALPSGGKRKSSQEDVKEN